MGEAGGKAMTHASLFSGIGGAEIAAEWVGWENLFHCEINPFGRKVLEYWYPNSMSYEDITKTDFTEWRGRIDVLTAGFPCQPFSLAGQRKGADDDRYLWPQVVRVIRETRPAWVVGENVAGILTMVQPGEEVEVGSDVSLFGEGDTKRVSLRQEYVIETVCRDLEREGYEVRPFVIPACAVGAPHRRNRVWIVARRITSDSADTRSESLQCGREDGVHAVGVTSYPDLNRQRERTYQQITVTGCEGKTDTSTCWQNGTVADSQCSGRREIYNEIQPQQPDGQRAYSNGDERLAAYTTNERLQRRMSHVTILPAEYFSDFPTQSPVRNGNDGLSLGLAGITFPKWRAESIKALGNAIVPQVIYEIFRAIQHEEEESEKL
ncbi:DNA (cytosine-5-)-methyltransferase [Bacteroides sp. ET225]|nr:DNA (cytosine-5-)-methyltransferase [Bacteroides sp. ET225]